MKKILFVLVFWIIIVFSLYIGFNMYTSKSYGIKNETELVSIDINSDEVKNITSNLLKTNYLRYGYYSPDYLSDEIIFKQIIYNLNEKDYKDITIRPTKVMCLVNDDLWFISVDTCRVRVIDKARFKDYSINLFNIEKDIDIKEIKFDGYYCKSYGNNYYCHVTYYKNTSKGYSYISSAYKDKKGNIYIYEYYLFIDFSKDDICTKYYDKEACGDIKSDGKLIDNKLIMDEGVYYKHTYMKNKLGNYYLASSEVVN